MRKRFTNYVVFIMLSVTGVLIAQQKTISGTIADIDDFGLGDITVTNSNTGETVYTDVDGNYSIVASEGDVLTFSGDGFTNQEITVGSNNSYSLNLQSDVIELESTVVTAFGIKKEEKALGYAVTQLDTEDFETRPENDIGRVLRGKAPGVRVTGSGGVSGSGTNIIIRGYSSIFGDNQPLFVIDGIPVSNATARANTGALSGDFQNANTTSRISDINPNDIENVSILKGLSATTLYGSQGRNGVILITTKSGKKAKSKLEFNVSQSYFINEVVLPDYQDTWGNGFNNAYGAFFSNWGSRFDSQSTIPNAYRTSILNNYGVLPSVLFPDRPDLDEENIAYQPFNSQEDFFRTGSTYVTDVSAAGSFDNGHFKIAYGHTTDESFIPGNTFARNNYSSNLTYNFSNKFSTTTVFNYSRSSFKSPMTDASQGSDVTQDVGGNGGLASIWNVLYIPRSVDLLGYPYQHPTTGESLWYRGGNDRTNPLWTVDNTRQGQETDRIIASMKLNYEFSENFLVSYRIGIDNYNIDAERWINRGNRDGVITNGYLQTTFERSTIWDQNLFGSYAKKDILEGLDFDAQFGVNVRRDEFDTDGSESRGQLIFGLQNHNNYTSASNIVFGTIGANSATPYQFSASGNLIGVYAAATLSYNDYVFLNLSARNDWSSKHENGYNSQFYPGVSVSFLPLDAFEGLKNIKFLDYWKLRAGYGTSAGFTSITSYPTQQTASLIAQFYNNGSGVVSGASLNDLLANPELEPELTEEFEFGMEMQFLKNRIGFDITYYDRETQDQILPADLPPSSGFVQQLINAGNVRNYGIELGFNITPIKTKDFTWTLNGVYTINESEVSGLEEGQQFSIGGIFSTPQNIVRNGEAFGVIFGNRIARDANGNRLVDSNGYWIQDTNNGIIGDPNPDWFGSLNSVMSYKGFKFNMLWEYQHGGDIYAQTVSTLIGRGLVEDVDFDRTQGIILDGVLADGSPNNIQITATEAYFDNIGFGIDEQSIYDATHLRLREASISYTLPKKMIENTPFGNITLSVIGQNLWVKAFNTPESVNYDPELNSLGVGNSQGFDYLTSWNSRRYGFNVKLSF